MAVFNDVEEENKLVLYPHTVKWVHRVPVASKADFQVVPFEKKEPLEEACRHFLECVDKRLTPQTDGKEAIGVLKILDQAQKELDKAYYE